MLGMSVLMSPTAAGLLALAALATAAPPVVTAPVVKATMAMRPLLGLGLRCLPPVWLAREEFNSKTSLDRHSVTAVNSGVFVRNVNGTFRNRNLVVIYSP